ncbi:glutathione S-transferase, partial [Lecanoromycetidae sp. Uapishka_2]
MSTQQPMILHAHPGPNPWKVVILLEELNLPYSTIIHTTPELKQPDFLALNPNGKAPVIEDPNTDLLLAESGAIMEYVLEHDTEKRISFPTVKEQWLMKQWLQFQTTTQGPLLQQIFFWTSAIPNKEARGKYVGDFRRVLRVLDDELMGKEWLVGGKCSAADLSYAPFHGRMGFIMGVDGPDVEAEFPNVDAWYKRMLARPSVQKAEDGRNAAFKESLSRDANLAKRVGQQ